MGSRVRAAAGRKQFNLIDFRGQILWNPELACLVADDLMCHINYELVVVLFDDR